MDDFVRVRGCRGCEESTGGDCGGHGPRAFTIPTAIDEDLCHHQHPMGPPGRIIMSHPMSEPCLLREAALRADLAAAEARVEALRVSLEAGAAFVATVEQGAMADRARAEAAEWLVAAILAHARQQIRGGPTNALGKRCCLQCEAPIPEHSRDCIGWVLTLAVDERIVNAPAALQARLTAVEQERDNARAQEMQVTLERDTYVNVKVGLQSDLYVLQARLATVEQERDALAERLATATEIAECYPGDPDEVADALDAACKLARAILALGKEK